MTIRKPRLSASCLFALVALPLISGCASTKVSKCVSLDQTNSMRNIAVVATCQNAALKVLDITDIRKKEYSKQYGGVMYGAIGGVLEVLIHEGVASYKICSLVGGSVGDVRKSVADFDARSAFDEILYARFSERIKAKTHIQNVVMLKSADLVQDGSGSNSSDEQKGNKPDTLLIVDYTYGIGAWVKEKPVPAIVANVSVRSVPKNETLMSDTVVSYSCDGNNYTLANYAENGGEKYRACFRQVVDDLARRIADEAFPWARVETERQGDQETPEQAIGAE